jgi:hypothetical protein
MADSMTWGWLAMGILFDLLSKVKIVPFAWIGSEKQFLIRSINFFVGANIDQEENFCARFWVRLSGKNNATVVTGGTCIKPGQLTA